MVVSNWDVSLHERLAETGLAPLVDGAVASAELGAAKPDPAIFARGLELAGAAPEEAWHVGDSPEADVEGARAAGVTPVLVARDGAPRRPASCGSRRSTGCSYSSRVTSVPPPSGPSRSCARAAGRAPARARPPLPAPPPGRDGLPRWPLWVPFATMLARS